MVNCLHPCVFMKKEDEQLNMIEGIVVIAMSVIILAIDIFVPAREGASPGGKYAAAGFALLMMGWGIRRIKSVKKKYDKK